MQISILIAVAAGGALGSVMRYLAMHVSAIALGQLGWPLLAINMAGSLVAGMAMQYPLSDAMRAFIITGTLGAFTTFSALAMLEVNLMQSGAWRAVIGWGMANLLGAIVACWLGYYLVARMATS